MLQYPVQAHPATVQILVAVVEYKTKLHQARKVSFLSSGLKPDLRQWLQGVCSMWLASLPASSIPVWVVPGTLSFPRQPHTPVIMIGPGTGCAPFRAYLEERIGAGESGEDHVKSCDQHLASCPQTICSSLVVALQVLTSSSGMSGQ